MFFYALGLFSWPDEIASTHTVIFVSSMLVSVRCFDLFGDNEITAMIMTALV